MKTCATCRFMAAKRDFDSLKNYRTCARIIQGNTWDWGEEKEVCTELAVVVDGSGYSARLIVLPEFGCVLHEEVNEETE